MRRALATTALVGGLALTPLAAAPAFAEAPAGVVLATDQLEEEVSGSTDGTDVDEPFAQDGDDDSGRWGLMGLLGLAGLFGYKKYKDHRASTQASTRTTTEATTRPSTQAGRGAERIGTVDTDGSGSTRI